MNKKRIYYRLEIIPVCGGWIVTAGCQKIVYMDTEEGRNKMKADFEAYLLDPDLMADRMLDQNIAISGQMPVAAPTGPVEDMLMRQERATVRPYPPEAQCATAGANLLRTPEELHARDREPR